MVSDSGIDRPANLHQRPNDREANSDVGDDCIRDVESWREAGHEGSYQGVYDRQPM